MAVLCKAQLPTFSSASEGVFWFLPHKYLMCSFFSSCCFSVSSIPILDFDFYFYYYYLQYGSECLLIGLQLGLHAWPSSFTLFGSPLYNHYKSLETSLLAVNRMLIKFNQLLVK